MTQMTDLIFTQLESLSEDEDRPFDERSLMKIHLRELRSEFARLERGEFICKKCGLRKNSSHDYLVNF